MENKTLNMTLEESPVLQDMKQVLNTARSRAASAVNREMVDAYWNMGRILWEYEQSPDYEAETILEMFPESPEKPGNVFSWSNMIDMRQFYLRNQDERPLSSRLSWAHHLELSHMGNADDHRFFAEAAQNANWSVEELKHQNRQFLYFHCGDASKEQLQKVTESELVRKTETFEPADSLHDPAVQAFLGLTDDRPAKEQQMRDMQKEVQKEILIQQIVKTVLGFGQGFVFAGSRKKIPLETGHCYVDVVFYNKILRTYVLIAVKNRKPVQEDADQMKSCLAYYAANVKGAGDNLPIGIFIHKEKDRTMEGYWQLDEDDNTQIAEQLLSMMGDMSLMSHLGLVLQEW